MKGRKKTTIIRDLFSAKSVVSDENPANTSPGFILIDARNIFTGLDNGINSKDYVVLKVIYNSNTNKTNNN